MSDLEDLYAERQRLTEALASSRRETNQTQADLKALKKKITRAKLETAESKRWWGRLWYGWRSNAVLRRENRELRAKLKHYRAARGFAERVLIGSELRQAARAWVVAVRVHKDPRKWVDVELADLGAAVVRRFVRVGFVGLAVAALPLILLWRQNALIQQQTAEMQAQNRAIQEQNVTIREQVDQQAKDTLIVRRAQLLDTIYACTEAPPPSEAQGEDGKAQGEGPVCTPNAHIRARQEAVLAFVQIERDREVRVNLYRANLDGANLAGANLTDAILINANLTDADLAGANLTRAHLSKVCLFEANLTNANLRNATLRGANLTNAQFPFTDLTGVDLASADLTDAFLWIADLRGASLSGANLHGTNLTDVDLTDANLYRATLTGANLTDADFSGARDLTQEQINSANGDRTTILPEGLVHPDHWPERAQRHYVSPEDADVEDSTGG